jgi:hypothetical protein
MTNHDPIYAVGYARVSTPKQAVEGESLDIQAEAIRRHITGRGWTVFPADGVLQEPFTGATDNRPIYQAAIRLIKSNPGKVRYFLIKTIDRFSREGAFGYKQMKRELSALGVELRDIGGVIQPVVNSLEHLNLKYSWSERSPSDLGEVVIAEAADQERHRLLTRMVETEVNLTRDGYHLGPANDGYVSRRVVVEGRKKVAQFPDPERAHYFRTMFEMRADGAYSDREIVRRVNEMGFRTKSFSRWDKSKTKIIDRSGGRPLTVKRFQKLIQRPAYCGVVVRKWTGGQPIRAKGGEALVSIDLFNRANRSRVRIDDQDDGSLRIIYDEQITKEIPKRHKFSSRWRFKNVVLCPRCKRPLWASASRGRSGQKFAAYHCARDHERYSVSQPTLDAAFGGYLGALAFERDFWDSFGPLLERTFLDAADDASQVDRQRRAELPTLEDRRRQLCLAFADASSPSIRRVIEEQVTQLDVAIDALKSGDQSFRCERPDYDAFLSHARAILEHPAEVLENIMNFKEQVTLYGLLFAEWPTYEEIVSGTAQLRPMFVLSERFRTVGTVAVHRRGLDWNTLHQEMLRWKDAYWAIDAVIDRIKLKYGSFPTPPDALAA